MALEIRNSSFAKPEFQQFPQADALQARRGVGFNYTLSSIQANDPAPAAPVADSSSGCCGITGFISRICNAITGCLSGTWNKFLGFFGRAPAAAPAAAAAAPTNTVKDSLTDFLALYSDKKAKLGKSFKKLPSAERKAVIKKMIELAKAASNKPKTVSKDAKDWKAKIDANPNLKALRDAVEAIVDERKKAAAAPVATPATSVAPAV